MTTTTDEDDATNTFKQGLSAGFATLFARNFAQPFDVVKIRFQIQVEPIRKQYKDISKYYSMRQAFRTIYKEEGMSALWKGNVPGLTISTAFSIIQFTSYEKFFLWSKGSHIERKYPNLNNFLCGTLSGALGIFIVQPFDVSKTRLISQDHYTKGYRNLREAFMKIYNSEGFSGLYRGTFITIGQIGLYYGFSFMFYRCFTGFLMPIFEVKKRQDLPIWALTSIGALTATLIELSLYPMDTIRRRKHVQGFENYRTNFGAQPICTSYVDCVRNLIKEEGFLSFYKGCVPSLCRNVVFMALQMTFYDTFNSLFKISAS